MTQAETLNRISMKMEGMEGLNLGRQESVESRNEDTSFRTQERLTKICHNSAIRLISNTFLTLKAMLEGMTA